MHGKLSSSRNKEVEVHSIEEEVKVGDFKAKRRND